MTALRQHFSMSPEYFHMDRPETAKRARLEELDASRLRLRTTALRTLPTQWKGKRYLGLEKARDPQAALKAEAKERDRSGRKVVALLVEARLPFGLDFEARNVDWASVEAMRCLKGLHAASLRKRVSAWEPFHRFLLTERGLHFPTETWQILTYFEVRREELAARSVYGSLLSSLRFLEEAGEVPLARKLSGLDALLNAVKELETARAKQAESDGR